MITNAICTKLNAPIGWLGGKTRLRPTIIGSMPKHHTYVETFCGSATIFFGKPASLSSSEILNDINGELVNFMRVISGTYFNESVRQEFIEYVRTMPAAREVFEEWKRWDETKLNTLTPAQRAFRFYYCTKKGFSCVITGGYESSPLSSNRYNMSSDFDYIPKRFRELDAQIERMDFRELMKKYSHPRADSFFFIDPPYFVANNTNYYEFVFTERDHLDLKDSCDMVHKNRDRFLITYDDVQDVIKLYSDYYIYRTDPIIYSAMQSEEHREIKKTELFITNYDIVKMLKSRSQKDVFEELDANDTRIDFKDHIGLNRIQ